MHEASLPCCSTVFPSSPASLLPSLLPTSPLFFSSITLFQQVLTEWLLGESEDLDWKPATITLLVLGWDHRLDLPGIEGFPRTWNLLYQNENSPRQNGWLVTLAVTLKLSPLIFKTGSDDTYLILCYGEKPVTVHTKCMKHDVMTGKILPFLWHQISPQRKDLWVGRIIW